MVFNIFSLITVIITVVWFFVRLRIANHQTGAVIKWWRQSVKMAWREVQNKGWFRQTGMRRLSYFLVLDLMLVLSLSALIQPWFFQQNMSGLLLLMHMITAPFFAVFLVLFAFYWSHTMRFNDKKNKQSRNLKLCYWSGLTTALIVIAASTIAMFPLAGNSVQITLATIHKYAAVVLVVLFFLHAYLIMTMRFEPAKAKQKDSKKKAV